MQIHEIFQQTNENVLKGIATAASSALTRAAHNYLGTDPKSYQIRGATGSNPFVDKSDDLRKMTQPLAAGLAQQQFKNWNAALAKQGVDSPSKLAPKIQDNLKSMVLRNANKTFGVYDLLNFSKNVEPSHRQAAEGAQKNILTAVNNIMSKPGQQTQQDWNDLVNNAQEASTLIRMYSGTGYGGASGGDVDVTYDGKTFSTPTRELNPNVPADEEIINRAIKNKRFKSLIAPQTQPGPVTGVQVAPGKRIRVQFPNTRGIYYKTSAGWTNEVGQKIEDPTAINQLERYADAGYGREENIVRTQPKRVIKKKSKGKTRVR